VTLRFGLLGLLAYRPADVFSLEADFEALFDGLWPVTAEDTARAVTELEQEALVEHQDLPGTSLPERPIYEPTAAGRRALVEWLEAPPDGEAPIEDELALRLALDQTLDAQQGLSLIWAERQACTDGLERLYAVRDSGTLQLAATLLLERAIVTQETRMRWLEFCEERLVEQA
jgi:DNA-binding PadR family transcriptional regulator